LKKVVDVCLGFCDYYEWYNGRLSFLINGPSKSGFEDWPRAYQVSGADDLLVGVTDVGKQVAVFEGKFQESAKGMLKDLQYYGSVETSAFSNLGVRLDYNGFYSRE
jgi:hypothetical protein